jgi:hypothetical protein
VIDGKSVSSLSTVLSSLCPIRGVKLVRAFSCRIDVFPMTAFRRGSAVDEERLGLISRFLLRELEGKH